MEEQVSSESPEKLDMCPAILMGKEVGSIDVRELHVQSVDLLEQTEWATDQHKVNSTVPMEPHVHSMNLSEQSGCSADLRKQVGSTIRMEQIQSAILSEQKLSLMNPMDQHLHVANPVEHQLDHNLCSKNPLEQLIHLPNPVEHQVCPKDLTEQHLFPKNSNEQDVCLTNVTEQPLQLRNESEEQILSSGPTELHECLMNPIEEHDGSKIPIAKHVGSMNPMEQHVDSKNPMEKPVGSKNSMEQSGWTDPLELPVGSKNSMERSVGWKNPVEPPIGSKNIMEQHVGSRNPMERPAGSENPMKRPVGRKNPMEPSAGSKNLMEHPVGWKSRVEPFFGSKNPMAQPVVKNSLEQHIGWKNPVGPPVGSRNQMEQTFGSKSLPEHLLSRNSTGHVCPANSTNRLVRSINPMEGVLPANLTERDVRSKIPMEQQVRPAKPIEFAHSAKPMEHQVRSVGVIEQQVRPKNPMLQHIRRTHPMEQNVRLTSPMEQHIRPNILMEHHVRPTVPVEQQARMMNPMGQQVRPMNRVERQVLSTNPIEQQVRPTHPMENNVSSTSPMEKHVHSMNPVEKHVHSTNLTGQPVHFENPVQHQGHSTHLMEYHVRTANPLNQHLRPEFLPERHVRPAILPQRHLRPTNLQQRHAQPTILLERHIRSVNPAEQYLSNSMVQPIRSTNLLEEQSANLTEQDGSSVNQLEHVHLTNQAEQHERPVNQIDQHGQSTNQAEQHAPSPFLTEQPACFASPTEHLVCSASPMEDDIFSKNSVESPMALHVHSKSQMEQNVSSTNQLINMSPVNQIEQNARSRNEMEHHTHTKPGNSEENVGIPEHLRCKRSDGKQWRCNGLSMTDKTVCEKHYHQAKRRVANSVSRVYVKKPKINSFGDSDTYMDNSGNDEMDLSPFVEDKGGEDLLGSISGLEYKSPTGRSFSTQNLLTLHDEVHSDDNQLGMESVTNNKDFDNGSLQEFSDDNADSSDASGGLMCHQCQRNDTGKVNWCLNCGRRGYCDSCIQRWYIGIPLQEIQRICPACRGTCNCKVCLRGDFMIKDKIRQIPVSDKLQYHCCILSSILPVIKRIYSDQCSELELETRLQGKRENAPRIKVNADEQMFCNCCGISIIDYHRHCTRCLYDLCLTCCQNLRQESMLEVKGESVDNLAFGHNEESEMKQPKSSKLKWNSTLKYPDWDANSDGSIPCPPKASGGCGFPFLSLRRLLKMNWVAKLMKSVDEMVTGCKVFDMDPHSSGLSNSSLFQFSQRMDNSDNFLYCPASQDIKQTGINYFRKHWVRGKPVIIKQAYDCETSSNWDPMAIWSGIRKTASERMNVDTRTVKAIDCLNWTEVDIELGEFIKGYTDGKIHEDGWPEMLKLENWPSPGATEEFLLEQKPEFISKLPLFEYIHSKFGLLNVASKLPQFSLLKDVGPKFLISYGTYEELGRGDSVTNLQTSMRDTVYFLMDAHKVDSKCWQPTKNKKEKSLLGLDPGVSVPNTQQDFSIKRETLDNSPIQQGNHDNLTNKDIMEGQLHKGVHVIYSSERKNNSETRLSLKENEIMEDQSCNGEDVTSSCGRKKLDVGPVCKNTDGVELENAHAGAVWDVFRRQDVPMLVEYLTLNWTDFEKPSSQIESGHPLYDKIVFLSKEHKRKLKEEFKIEPWTFEQHLGDAVFIPAGCPFQVRNLQSSVQLAFDFLSPESLKDSVQLAEEIRCLPNGHEAKLQMLEVGKMSLYAASSVIKEVEKLAFDPKVRGDLSFEDPNLTAMVSDNLEKVIKGAQVACA